MGIKRPLCLLFAAVLTAVLILLSFNDKAAEDPFSSLDGTTRTITGTLIRREEAKNGRVYEIRPKGSRLSVQVYPEKDAPAGGWDDARIGQTLRVSGEVSCFESPRNPGQFDSLRFYRTKRIAFRMYNGKVLGASGEGNAYAEGLTMMREAIALSVTRSLPEEDAGVMRSVLIGDRSALTPEIRSLYRRNGILHILAVSGLHITFLGLMLKRLLVRCGMRELIAGLLCIPVMLSYGIMCGMSISALRAVMMFSLRMAAPLLHRTYDMLSAMSLTGITMLFEEPLYATDTGFLLSFGAIAGIGIMQPLLEDLFPERKRDVKGIEPGAGSFFKRSLLRTGGMLRTGLKASCAILLATLPVYHCCFYTVPPYAVLLNVPVVLLAGALLAAGWLSVPAGWLFPAAGAVVSLPCRGILGMYRVLCEAADTLPGSTVVVGRAAAIQVVLYYALLLGLTVYAGRNGKEAVQGRRRSFIAVTAAALCVLFVRAPEPFTITVADVGQGDGIIIRNDQRTYMIDGGSSSVSSVGEYRLHPYLRYAGTGHLDAVFVSHEDEDHISGIRELMEDAGKSGITIGYLYLPTVRDGEKSESYLRMEELAAEHDIPVGYLKTGQRFKDGALTLTCLGPSPDEAYSESANAHSGILHLSYGDFSALFTGDVEAEGLDILNGVLERLPASYRDLTLLKVAHHGSRYTTDERFLSLIDARISVISCGVDNRYGHPHEELRARLVSDGTDIYTTAESGAVTLKVSRDGGTVWLSTHISKK